MVFVSVAMGHRERDHIVMVSGVRGRRGRDHMVFVSGVRDHGILIYIYLFYHLSSIPVHREVYSLDSHHKTYHKRVGRHFLT